MTVVIILLLAGGIFFFLVGVAGLLRLPDVFCRMHATTKCDTLGAGLLLLALALYAGFPSAAVKLLLLIVLIWIANPTAAHVIARAAYLQKDKTAPGTLVLDRRGEVRAHD
ncbi:MAG: monovalent cation/H(+) antiporter subunit G [Firmicutes bacterium]|jgi:multicomponent Na+:H+ antiporter subunit G|nr:monovalent cation/H(+) antiporter subunit G [Bacillota bacterium]